MEETFVTSFSNEQSSESLGALSIVQEEWKQTTGMVSKVVFFSYVLNAITRNPYPAIPVDCGFNTDMELQSTIYVYPKPLNLNYSLKTTYGRLSSRRISTVRESESVAFSISNSASIKYMPEQTPTYEWVGVIRDAQGGILQTPPTVTFDANNVYLSQKVYGTLLLKYTVVRHSYVSTVVPREEGAEDFCGAVLYAPFDGGISWLEMSVPPSIDDIVSGASLCGGSTQGNVIIGPDGELIEVVQSVGGGDNSDQSSESRPRYASPVDEVYTYDYCTGDLINYSKGAAI